MGGGELPEAELPPVAVEIPGGPRPWRPGEQYRQAFCPGVSQGAPSDRGYSAVPPVAGRHLSGAGGNPAGPGFLNFFLSPAFYAAAVAEILEQKDQYGRSDYGAGKKVMVEFVSANPTGPMHMAMPGAAPWGTAWPPCWTRRLRRMAGILYQRRGQPD